MLIGFVGLGTMGARMASNLQKGGFKLVVHDLRKEAAAPHLAAGASWGDTPRAVAAQSDVILTSLPEPSDVEAVALGTDGLLAGVKSGAAWFDLSTNAPSVRTIRCEIRGSAAARARGAPARFRRRRA